MKVSHIIRGQEFIASQPNYLNIYEALGLDFPIFATMPHIMADSGNKKMGKRDGSKDALDYLKDGYLPETMINFIASLGWNDGTEQEIFTVAELTEKFSLDRVQKSGARFDEKRLEWMNGQHIRLLSLDDLYARVTEFWPASAATASEELKKHVLELVQDRLKTLKDLAILTDYFFTEPTEDWTMIENNKQLAKLPKDELKQLLQASFESLGTSDFTPEAVQETLNQLLITTGQKPGILFSLIRTVVSWAPFSPALDHTLSVLGKETSLARIDAAIKSIS